MVLVLLPLPCSPEAAHPGWSLGLHPHLAMLPVTRVPWSLRLGDITQKHLWPVTLTVAPTFPTHVQAGGVSQS